MSNNPHSIVGTVCYWCGNYGTISKKDQEPPRRLLVPHGWRVLPIRVTNDLRPKQTRIQRFRDTRVPFCPNYGTAKCQPSKHRQAEILSHEAKVFGKTKIKDRERLVSDFRDFLSRVIPADFARLAEDDE